MTTGRTGAGGSQAAGERLRPVNSRRSALIRDVLSGSPGPPRDIVVLNAAAALHAATPTQSPEQCARRAAESIDAKLRGVEPVERSKPPVDKSKIRLDWYEAKERHERQVIEPEQRLAKPFDEVDLGLTAEAALEEVTRCFSCGKCFGCENCWMYCQANVFAKVDPPSQGNFFKIKKIEACDGCKKCWEECPCGFIVGE